MGPLQLYWLCFSLVMLVNSFAGSKENLIQAMLIRLNSLNYSVTLSSQLHASWLYLFYIAVFALRCNWQQWKQYCQCQAMTYGLYIRCCKVCNLLLV